MVTGNKNSRKDWNSGDSPRRVSGHPGSHNTVVLLERPKAGPTRSRHPNLPQLQKALHQQLKPRVLLTGRAAHCKLYEMMCMKDEPPLARAEPRSQGETENCNETKVFKTYALACQQLLTPGWFLVID